MYVGDHPSNTISHPAPGPRTELAGDIDSNSSNQSVVQYQASHASTSVPIGRDLGSALKLMQEHRRQFPNSPAKMGASYE